MKKYSDQDLLYRAADTFRLGYESYEASRIEAAGMWDLFHNRHYTHEQLNLLQKRGQPAETFNIIKLFSRTLLGYYSTVMNTISAKARRPDQTIPVLAMNDAIQYTLRKANWQAELDKVKLDMFLTGLAAAWVDVQPTGERDEYGRPLHEVLVEHVPSREIVIDPMSRRFDYTDARFIHRFKWVSEVQLRVLFPDLDIDELESNDNFTGQPDAEREGASYDLHARQVAQLLGGGTVNGWVDDDAYLIVHSIMVLDDGSMVEMYWHNDTILQKYEVQQFPYIVHKMHFNIDPPEYYGIFRDVKEAQLAIDQAVLKIQLMVNTDKVFVREGAVENLADFTTAYNRVSGVIPVLDLAGIQVEKFTHDIQQQYIIIDQALDRIQRVLGINDSFLGMAYASDSGAKVQLQKQATIVALRYLTVRLESFHRVLGWQIIRLIQEWFYAHQWLRLTDEIGQDRWTEINRPLLVPTGRTNPDGTPELKQVWEEVIDPKTGEVVVDEQGRIVMAPVPDPATEIRFTHADIEVESTAWHDEDEQARLMTEQVLNSLPGQLLAQANPSGLFAMAALAARSFRIKHAPDIASIFEQTAQMMAQQQQMAAQLPAQMQAEQAQQGAAQLATQAPTGGVTNG